MWTNEIWRIQTKQISWGKWYRHRNGACKYAHMSEQWYGKRERRKINGPWNQPSNWGKETGREKIDPFLFSVDLFLHTLARYLPVIQISYLLSLSDQSPQFFKADAFAYTRGFYIVIALRCSLRLTDQIT